ncbi:class D beta-lactamase [Microvirga makkahensis]|uniref:Penicillin-binding protein transpeptidase domain-containing protein n=1 Tax=Microvirga makkahensis TaxID=1128670 RepID=A0A7X3MTM6_9HYPH|nr:class D beta-lactamase [Microvirga makkahensis]MXQ12838.1 hypothetical protein [Microvirga makkahensis]
MSKALRGILRQLDALMFTRRILSACMIAAAPAAAYSQPRLHELSSEPFRAEVADRHVTFYAVDSEAGVQYAFNPKDIDERHPPFSSFKIPNLMIALETGVASNLNHVRKWDQNRRPAAEYWPVDWRQDQTLGSAFMRSAAWYFQDLALEIGAKRYREYLQRFRYGNANVPEGSDTFWLDDPDAARRLLISPREQVAFIKNAIEGQFELRTDTLTAFKKVAELQNEGGYKLYGKTGSGPVQAGNLDGAFQGWLVGLVERPQKKPVFYALYARGPGYSSILKFRRDFAETLLKEIGALPVNW